MDNQKTGALIRGLRKERGLTQKELAAKLHITDKAVSKWERGLCAPDLALLEPLAEALGASVVELIRGVRLAREARLPETEEDVKNVIDCGKSELARKTRGFRRRAALAAACCALALLAIALALWRRGAFSVLERGVSPDGKTEIIVYAGDVFSHEYGFAVSARTRDLETGVRSYSTYANSAYRGLWWSPTGKKCVIALDCGGETQLMLRHLDWYSETRLNANLPHGSQKNEQGAFGIPYDEETALVPISYEMLQWSSDGAAILIFYAYTDAHGAVHSGYFWYFWENGGVCSVLELAPGA